MNIKSYRNILIQIISVIILFLFDFCSAKNVSALFIFGDSLVDAGNNFYLKTIAQPLYPNGIDFGTTALSRRYSNGRTIVDIIGQKLGFQKFIPPYLSPTTTGDVILKGVNFASSGAGVFEDTGSYFGEHIPLDQQIDYFAETREDIIIRIGSNAAKELIKQALFFVVFGANDLVAVYKYKNASSQEAYIDSLVAKLRSQLATLYTLDARKVVVSNAAKVGCVPALRDRFPQLDGCVTFFNLISKSFGSKLKRLITNLNDNLDGSRFVCGDTYAIVEDLTDNFVAYGFEDAVDACCNSGGRHGGENFCKPMSKVCPDRRKFVFWDWFHFTEAANLIAARHLLDGGPKFAWPINVRRLADS